jgi:DNA-binding Lrp family transcriptional regulator
MPQLSPVDQVLVTELQKNARITNRALAQAAGIAESTCLERVRALHQQGVLRGFHASVNLEPLDRHVQALIAVRLQPKTRTAVEGFRDFIITRPETLALFVISGSDDFLILVAVADTRHLEGFVLDHIAQHPHIADVRTSLVYEHLERLPIEPLDPPASPTPRQQPTHRSR